VQQCDDADDYVGDQCHGGLLLTIHHGPRYPAPWECAREAPAKHSCQARAYGAFGLNDK